MLSPPLELDAKRAAFEGLRVALSTLHRSAAPEAFTLAEETIVRTGLGELDLALGGGFPRGAIATIEGAPGSGRSAVVARLLATATANGGLGALIEMPNGPEGAFYPPALAAAGVDLARLLVIGTNDAQSVARAADIVLRAEAFGVVVIPTLSLRAPVWTRLASLAHRANVVFVVFGESASDELRYFASLRIRLRAANVRFAGSEGLFCTLAGLGVEAAVLKHKRAAPGRRATFDCTTFERSGPALVAVRDRPVTLFAPDRAVAR